MTIAESVHRFLLAGAEESFEGSSQLQVVGRVGISVVELRCTSPGACKLISNSTGSVLFLSQTWGSSFEMSVSSRFLMSDSSLRALR